MNTCCLGLTLKDIIRLQRKPILSRKFKRLLKKTKKSLYVGLIKIYLLLGDGLLLTELPKGRRQSGVNTYSGVNAFLTEPQRRGNVYIFVLQQLSRSRTWGGLGWVFVCIANKLWFIFTNIGCFSLAVREN